MQSLGFIAQVFLCNHYRNQPHKVARHVDNNSKCMIVVFFLIIASNKSQNKSKNENSNDKQRTYARCDKEGKLIFLRNNLNPFADNGFNRF